MLDVAERLARGALWQRVAVDLHAALELIERHALAVGRHEAHESLDVELRHGACLHVRLEALSLRVVAALLGKLAVSRALGACGRACLVHVDLLLLTLRLFVLVALAGLHLLVLLLASTSDGFERFLLETFLTTTILLLDDPIVAVVCGRPSFFLDLPDDLADEFFFFFLTSGSSGASSTGTICSRSSSSSGASRWAPGEDGGSVSARPLLLVDLPLDGMRCRVRARHRGVARRVERPCVCARRSSPGRDGLERRGHLAGASEPLDDPIRRAGSVGSGDGRPASPHAARLLCVFAGAARGHQDQHRRTADAGRRRCRAAG